MTWKKTGGDDSQLTDVEFTGRVVNWAQVVKRSHSDYFPVNMLTWLLFMTAGFAREAKAKWESGWFSKRKLEGLQKLENPSAYNPFNILDYLAERLDSNDLDAMKEKAFAHAFNVLVVVTHEKNQAMAELVKATQEKSYTRYDKPYFAKFILSSYLHDPRLSKTPFDTFISKFLRTIARESLSHAKHPDAPVVKSITPLLKINADGTVMNPLKLFEELCLHVSVESANSGGAYLQKILDATLVG
jgi:hypothetical protein